MSLFMGSAGELASEPVTPPEILVRINAVSKQFGDVKAVNRLSLDIYEGEFFALLGASGCGKTTLMRMLAGFETPSSGDIKMGDQDLLALPPNKRPVNMMFQSYALFPHLSVWDNIAFGLKRSAMPKTEIDARVEQMLALVQLAPLAHRKPHQISGGQSQRVALARSLARGPKLLLLDEPLAALDKKLRRETQFELVDIQEQTGTTFLIVTHDQEEAMTVADRLGIMHEGSLVQVDTPDRVYEMPNSVNVAEFVGDINLIEGNVASQKDGKVEIIWAEGEHPITARHDAPLVDGNRCVYAVRPEKLRLSAEVPASGANAFRGKIIDIAYHGHISTYHVALPSGHLVKAMVTNQRRKMERGLTWEDTVWLIFDTDAGLVLVR